MITSVIGLHRALDPFVPILAAAALASAALGVRHRRGAALVGS